MMGGPSENPELWAFLKSLHRGEFLSGTVTAIERFGVFVALDDRPDHPVFPGVGFISFAELSWRHFEAATDVVQVGQRVSCEFLQFDTWNLEARLSLQTTQPDPFQVFADTIAVGQKLPGQVTKLVPFGVFVQVADGIEGLVHLRELAWTPVETPADVVQVGDEITVVVTESDAGYPSPDDKAPPPAYDALRCDGSLARALLNVCSAKGRHTPQAGEPFRSQH